MTYLTRFFSAPGQKEPPYITGCVVEAKVFGTNNTTIVSMRIRTDYRVHAIDVMEDEGWDYLPDQKEEEFDKADDSWEKASESVFSLVEDRGPA
jgi:hypothetical protein